MRMNIIITFIQRCIQRLMRSDIRKSSAEKPDDPLLSVPHGTYTTFKSLLNELQSTMNILDGLKNRGLSKEVLDHGLTLYASESTYVSATKLMAFKAYKTPRVMFTMTGWSATNADADYKGDILWATQLTRLQHILPQPGCTYYQFGGLFGPYKELDELVATWFIEVNTRTGTVRAMPWLRTSTQYVKRAKGVGYTAIPVKQYTFGPPASDGDMTDGTPLTEGICKRFILTYNLNMAREQGVNVIAHRGKGKVVFVVEENRWRYFFKNRDKEDEAIRRLPIFHAVVAHERKLASGKRTYVRLHYQGSRRFTWEGMEIEISMPIKHHFPEAADRGAYIGENDDGTPLEKITDLEWAQRVEGHTLQ